MISDEASANNLTRHYPKKEEHADFYYSSHYVNKQFINKGSNSLLC